MRGHAKVGVVLGPTFSVLPTVTGAPTVGVTLGGTDGTASGNGAVSYSRQYYRNGAPIAGATAIGYTVTLADEGYELSKRTTATDLDGPTSVSTVLGFVTHVAPASPGPLAANAITVNTFGSSDFASGVTGEELTFAMAPGSAEPQPGLSLSAAGLLSGTPTQLAVRALTVRISNSGGHVDRAHTLSTRTVPATMNPPALESLGANSIRVTRGNAPVDNNSAITGYTLRWRELPSGAFTEQALGVTADVTGLLANTSYEVQQVATNGAGRGLWSAGSSVTTAVTSAAPWTTEDLPSLVDHFRADVPGSITATGNLLTRWTDTAPAGSGAPHFDGEMTTGIETINGIAALGITDNATHGLAHYGDYTPGASPMMFYLVATSGKVGDNSLWWSMPQDGSGRISLSDNQGTWYFSVGAVGVAAPRVAGTNVVTLYKNGGTIGISVNGGTTVTATGALDVGYTNRMFIGRANALNEFWNKPQGKLAAFARTLAYDASDFQRIQGEMCHKYGVALPGGHPYFSAPPTQGGAPAVDTGTAGAVVAQGGANKITITDATVPTAPAVSGGVGEFTVTG